MFPSKSDILVFFPNYAIPLFTVSSATDKRGQQRRRGHVSMSVYRRAAPHPSSDSPRGRQQGERADRVNALRSGRMLTQRCRNLQRLTHRHKKMCCVTADLLVALKVAVKVDLQPETLTHAHGLPIPVHTIPAHTHTHSKAD